MFLFDQVADNHELRLDWIRVAYDETVVVGYSIESFCCFIYGV